MDDDRLRDHNEAQRQRIGGLGLEALDLIDGLVGAHMIADAMLIVEVVFGEAEDHRTETHVICTTDRITVRRGIVEQVRDGMVDSGYIIEGD